MSKDYISFTRLYFPLCNLGTPRRSILRWLSFLGNSQYFWLGSGIVVERRRIRNKLLPFNFQFIFKQIRTSPSDDIRSCSKTLDNASCLFCSRLIKTAWTIIKNLSVLDTKNLSHLICSYLFLDNCNYLVYRVWYGTALPSCSLFSPSFVPDFPLSIPVCPWAAWPASPLVPPGSGACHPAFATVPSKPLVMAALAPAVAACAHSRPLAQSLSRPIYLTQTPAPRPSPAYLSSAWFSLGVSNSPVPLHPGSGNEGEGALCRATWVVWEWVCMCLTSNLWGVFYQRKMATTDSRENNLAHCQTHSHTVKSQKCLLSLSHQTDLFTPVVPCTIFYPALASIPQQTYD